MTQSSKRIIVIILSATMKWWNDLWLNEGFASYMEFKALQVVHPDWDVVCIIPYIYTLFL